MEPGDAVAIRDVHLGQVWFATPAVVVEANPASVLVCHVPGSVGFGPAGYPGDVERMHEQLRSGLRTLTPFTWRHTFALHLLVADQWWSARLFWSETTREFLGHYVDFRVPPVFDGSMIDTRDLALDIWVPAGGPWQWKDEDHFAWGVAEGVIDAERAAAVDAARHEAIAAIESGAFPFDGSLVSWEPPDVEPPSLPAGWETLDA